MIYKQEEVIGNGSTLTIYLINKLDDEHFNQARDLIDDNKTQIDLQFPFYTQAHSFYIHRNDNVGFTIIADHNSFPFEDRLMACSIINDIYQRVSRTMNEKSKLKVIGKIINDAYMTVTEKIITDGNKLQ